MSEPEFKEFLKMFDTQMASTIQSLAKAATLVQVGGRPVPFDIDCAARSLHVPFIRTSLLDILAAGLLDPKSSSDRRTLKGYSLELGLFDFLNPPWPSYVLEIATRKKKANFDDVSKIMKAGNLVGHPPREVNGLEVNPRKLFSDPKDGIETLEQNNLVATEAQEYFRLTGKGREYIGSVRRKPQKSALEKAADWLGEHMYVGFPPFFKIGKIREQ